MLGRARVIKADGSVNGGGNDRSNDRSNGASTLGAGNAGAGSTSAPGSAAATRRAGEDPWAAHGRAVARRLDGQIVDAYAEAARIVEEARAKGEAELAEARARVARVAEDAANEARARETAKLAAGFLALAHARESAHERAIHDTAEMAKVLAERLLGAELALAPERVALLAAHALKEARGARRAKIRANASDAAILGAKIRELGLHEGSVEIVTDDSLSQGSLLLDTDLGVLDARLAPQLERLTEALTDVLRARA